MRKEEQVRKYKALLEQIGNANRKIIELEGEIKRKTLINRRVNSGFGGYVISFGCMDNSKPEVNVVDAVQLILDHLGLEITENEKFSLAEKTEEESNG